MLDMDKKRTKDKSENELSVFTWASVVCFVLAVFAFQFLIVASIPLAVRALILTFRKQVKDDYYIPRYRVVIGIVLVGSVWILI
jgi:hypothetical protein